MEKNNGFEYSNLKFHLSFPELCLPCNIYSDFTLSAQKG